MNADDVARLKEIWPEGIVHDLLTALEQSQAALAEAKDHWAKTQKAYFALLAGCGCKDGVEMAQKIVSHDALCARLEEVQELTSRLNLEIAGLVSEGDTLRARIAALEKQNFDLSAAQCHDGYGDDYGNWRCRYQDRLAALEAENKVLRNFSDEMKGLRWEVCESEVLRNPKLPQKATELLARFVDRALLQDKPDAEIGG